MTGGFQLVYEKYSTRPLQRPVWFALQEIRERVGIDPVATDEDLQNARKRTKDRKIT